MEYIYHIKPEIFKGDSILPLSELKEEYPEIYKKEYKKYKDRVGDVDREILPLKTTWESIVNLSTINPIMILTVAELLGNKTDATSIFKIPISALKNKDCVLYTYSNKKESYKKFNINGYEEGDKLPKESIEYLFKESKRNKKPLIFEYIPHILVADNVSIEDAVEIEYEPGNFNVMADAFLKEV